QGHTEFALNHKVKVLGLRPNQNYEYQLRWIDEDANLSESGMYSTHTTAEPLVQDLTVSEIRQTTAIVSFKVTSAAKATLRYGRSLPYDTQISLGTDYGVSFAYKLENLESGKEYHLSVKAEDQDGLEFFSSDYIFSTLPYPSISNLRLEPLPERPSTSYKLTWTTNVKTSSVVTYTQAGGASKQVSSADMVTSHEMEIVDLADNATYTIVASGRDEYGNEARSD
ncbi:MAG: hypothetical protein COV00_01660, partial [Candidatus Tagabacteria bacterium CG10_big_fil_rev_8_21_14_0_10_40_13]